MKSFAFFVLKILFLVSFIAAAFDFMYTYAYAELINTSKFQYIKNQKGKKIDYAFYGSSRVVNHINPIVIDSCLHRNSINFGTIGATPKDIFTILKLTDYYKIKVDSVFIQSDYYYNNIERSSFLYIEMLPYIRENDIIKAYYLGENDFAFLYYVPFYRYCRSDSKLGIRELLASLMRNNDFEKNKGFLSQKGFGEKWQRELPKYIRNENVYNSKTIAFLKQRKYKYMFYIAPFRYDTKNIYYASLLKKKYPEFWDFSTIIKEDKKFVNGYHLNESGANDFSILFAAKIKEKQ